MRFPNWLHVYGDTSFRGECPLEVQEQVAMFAELRRRWPDTIGRLALHPRNEGHRDWRTAATHIAEGLARGAADLIVPGNPALVLELKRRDHTKCKLTAEEEKYLLAARDAGCVVCVSLGYESAMRALEDYDAKKTLGKAEGEYSR